MSLKQRLTDDMKAAMKSGEKDRLGVIRLINAAIKQFAPGLKACAEAITRDLESAAVREGLRNAAE